MSTLDPQTLRRELLLEQAIGQQLDELVGLANKAAAKLKASDRMEKNQLRNLLNVAVESRSVEVVINFVRYQIARNKGAWGEGPHDFGHHVINDIRTKLSTLASTVVGDLQKQLRTEERLAEPQALEVEATAYVRLVQLYLGYLNRAFYYGKETGNFDQLGEIANAH